jgi:CBS domain containing-hemolysin-like protein
LVSVAVPVVAIPLLLSLTFAFTRAAGRRWAESVIRNAVPVVEKLAPILVPLTPLSSIPTEGTEPTTRSSSGPDRASNTEEFKVVSGVLTFAEQHVREVMTPRTDIVAVREGTLVDEVSSVLVESRYSRIPVYRDSLDNIVGMYYAFDLLKLEPGAELTMRPVAMAPASKSSADLLFEMQRDRLQMAVVLDEYGGTAGIATLQDLLEELVQLTFHEVRRSDEREIAGAEVLEVSGTTPADEIASRFDTTLPGDAETVSGLLSRAAGRIPQTGERFVLAGLEFDILAATATRIERVVVRRGVTQAIHLSNWSIG